MLDKWKNSLFGNKMMGFMAQLQEQKAEVKRLDATIANNLKDLGFWEQQL